MVKEVSDYSKYLFVGELRSTLPVHDRLSPARSHNFKLANETYSHLHPASPFSADSGKDAGVVHGFGALPYKVLLTCISQNS